MDTEQADVSRCVSRLSQAFSCPALAQNSIIAFCKDLKWPTVQLKAGIGLPSFWVLALLNEFLYSSYSSTAQTLNVELFKTVLVNFPMRCNNRLGRQLEIHFNFRRRRTNQINVIQFVE